MSFSGGIDWVTVQAAWQNWVVGGSGLPAGSVYWSQQFVTKGPEPAISMRVQNIHDYARPWLDFKVNTLVAGPLTVSAVNTGADTLTITAHGLSSGDGPFQISSSGTFPAPLVTLTDYWIIVIDANTVQLAINYTNTGGGGIGNPITPIDLATTGSGTITIATTPNSQHAGHEITYLARALLRVTLTLTCFTSAAVGMGMAVSVLEAVRSRSVFPTQADTLLGANIGLIACEHVRAIHGVKDAVMFEPRAIMEVHFCLASEDAQDGTIIDYVELESVISDDGGEIADLNTQLGPLSTD